VDTTKGISAFLPTADGAPTEQPNWRKVLVVDDDPMMLRFVSAVLNGAGFDVLVAADGVDAIELIVQDPPDFLITDWKMPAFDGIELCRWVRQAKLPHYIYTILITSRTEVRHMVEAISAGADDFFSKPIRPGELLSRLQAGMRLLDRERALLFLSRNDQLTELLNRRTLFAEFEELWEAMSAESHPLSCVMLDLDHFKEVNDLYGHRVGDEVIAAAAHAMRRCLPEGALAGRYGGEEFCAILPHVDEAEAALWAERIHAGIAGETVCLPGGLFSITASLGVAQRQASMMRAQQLVDAADYALMDAKKAGRDRVVRATAAETTFAATR
jgi:diguanylate cyclase (GGDEF)-like protein